MKRNTRGPAGDPYSDDVWTVITWIHPAQQCFHENAIRVLRQACFTSNQVVERFRRNKKVRLLDGSGRRRRLLLDMLVNRTATVEEENTVIQAADAIHVHSDDLLILYYWSHKWSLIPGIRTISLPARWQCTRYLGAQYHNLHDLFHWPLSPHIYYVSEFALTVEAFFLVFTPAVFYPSCEVEYPEPHFTDTRPLESIKLEMFKDPRDAKGCKDTPRVFRQGNREFFTVSVDYVEARAPIILDRLVRGLSKVEKRPPEGPVDTENPRRLDEIRWGFMTWRPISSA